MSERSETVEKLMDELEGVMRSFEKRVIDFTDNDQDRQDLLDALASVDKVDKLLKDCKAAVQQKLSQAIPFGETQPLPTSLGATIEKKVGRPRVAWDHRAIKPVIIEALLRENTDPDSGTIAVPPTVLLMKAFDCCGINGWKKTVCGPLGVNIDRFCDVGEPNTNFIIRWP